ncbi:tetratricopeptide repeat protein [Allorhodopirellula heiligendammensis]|uniref:Tetratricopeptide repeat protein n=1 Tax=Allorhodopirellula heiligendammensis TaxID=2714739 RepID=A0A5C6BF42_9BACT|nr:hypothetical protein [Allorhodopirellula heiligendammensis]TWU09899.1 hypothetical protein Poly21_54480 [Allorhodopirellula heiligendammensis]
MPKPLVARTTSWWHLTIVLMILISFQGLGAYFFGLPGVVLGLTVYLLLRFSPRRGKRFQSAGLKLMGEERYGEAAEEFEKGYHFFDENRFYDRYRLLTMFDYSGLDWREMMLANCATNLALSGDKARARDLYRHCLTLYPESRLAKPALLFLEPEHAAE